jgi:hypothetical protein
LALPAGRPFFVVAQAQGLVPACRSGCRAGARVDFVLQQGAGLHGTVRRFAGGAVVPGTRITVHRVDPGGGRALFGTTTSDASGLYRIDGLPGGTVDVEVAPVALAAPRDFEVQLPPGAVLRLDIELHDGLTIRGRVRDVVTRTGIPDAEVSEGRGGRAVRTGHDGAFELPGFNPLANLSLAVRAPGYGTADHLLRGRGSTPEDTATDVEILLAKGRSVRGIVHGPDGRPRAGVYVAAVAADHEGPGEWFRSDWRSARSGPEGNFSIADLRPELAHELLLLAPGFATTLHPFPADEAARSDIDLGVLSLQPAASLAGRVHDERGAPVADHEVVLRGHNHDRFGGAPDAGGYRAIDSYVATRRCRTDDLGRFHFVDLPAGEFVVGAQQLDSHAVISVPVGIAAGAAVVGVELALVRGLWIEGAVTVDDGGSLPKCYCSIDPEDGQGTSGDVEVGPDGVFRCRGLAAGRYSVTVYPYASETDRAVGRSFEPVVVHHVDAGARGLSCQLVARRPVRGTVVDSAQAKVAGAWVAVFDGERAIASGTTGADGTFSLAVATRDPVWVGLVPPPDPEAPYRRGDVEAGTVATAGGDAVWLVQPAR